MKIAYTSDPIPVKLYVKQFIEEGNLIRPFVLRHLYSLFTKPQPEHIDAAKQCTLFAEEKKAPTQSKYYVKLPLPERIFVTKGFMLTPKAALEFSDTMEDYIKMLFECELEANIRRSIKEERKFSIHDMIIDLRAKFRLDEENFPFETIKKSLQRFCERENIDLQSIKIFGKSVPKKEYSIRNRSGLLSRKQFMDKFGVSKDEYCKLKNQEGVLSITKRGREDYVNLNLSILPPLYTITTS